MSSSAIEVSVLVPVFNNHETLAALSEKIQDILSSEKINYELMFVDDGSNDDTFNKIKFCKENNSNIRAIQLNSNYGQVPAIITGLKHVQGACCIVMSADLQEPTELIKEMIQHWKSGCDLVIADRISRTDSAVSKWFSLLLFSFLHLFNSKIPRKGFDFALLDKSLYLKLLSLNPYHCFLQLSMVEMAKSIKYVAYIRTQRMSGKSQWTLLKKINYALNAFAGISKHFYLKLFLCAMLLLIAFLTAVFFSNIIFSIILLIPAVLLIILSIMGFLSLKESAQKSLPVVSATI